MIAFNLLPEVTGVILAGGASTRFGSNKALAELDCRPLIQHVALVLEQLFPERLLVTGSPETFAFLNWPTVADRFSGAGPLAGIHAALATVRTPRAMVVGCDMPLVLPRLLRYLCSFAEEWDVVLPHPASGPEPLCALYHRRILSSLEHNLRRGERKLGQALSSLRIRRVGEEELLAVLPDLSSFSNINTPGDLDRLHQQRAIPWLRD